VIKSRADLDAYLEDRKSDPAITAGILGIEGAQVLEDHLGNLKAMDEAGFRTMGLTHFFDNEVGGSAHGIGHGGLTELGRAVVREMEERRMTVDLAHASPATIDDVLEMAKRPVIVSHTGVKGTHDSPRNLSDAHIDAIAQGGGLIGIGYWDGAVGEPTFEAIGAAMAYVRDRVGIEHLALGSDYDGVVEVSFDTSELAALTQALMAHGFSDEEIGLIMGGNAVRFFREALPAE
jgi:microsomal dipeptidase-like Zn-dependent dipeptidase